MGARKLRIPALLAATLAALSVATPRAEAIINQVSASPAQAKIAAVGSASISVDWQVRRVVVDPPVPGTISSPNLQVLIDGAVVATLPRALSQKAAGTQSTEMLRLRETVQIPQALVYRSVKESGSLTIRRIFFDSADGTYEDGRLLVTPSGGAASELSVQRVELSFDDDTRSRVLPKDEELRVVAEVKTSGVGLLNVQWEIASPATTAGTPVFRPFALVRQGVGGGGRTVITSPPLPTAEEGTHLVRLRVMEPDLDYTTPTLQYYVTAKRVAGAAAARRDILLTGPRPGEPLSAETRFSWSAVPGSDAYQLLFFTAPAGSAKEIPAKEIPADASTLAGVFVAGGSTETTLEAATLEHLPAGGRFLWKVIAIDGNGAIIGASAAREIHKP